MSDCLWTYNSDKPSLKKKEESSFRQKLEEDRGSRREEKEKRREDSEIQKNIEFQIENENFQRQGVVFESLT